MNRKKHSTCVFQDGWLSNDKYRKRIRKSQNKKELVALLAIKTSTYLQWEAVHWTHTLRGKKHQQLMLESSKSGVLI